MISHLIFAIYPGLIFVGLQYLDARTLGALVLVALALRYRSHARGLMRDLSGMSWAAAAIPATVGLTAVVANSEVLLRLYPASISAGLLLLFATTLVRPPSMVERIALVSEPNLPPEGVRYTHRVTTVWCVFFVANGSAAAYTALWASREVWVLYNGFIAYLLIGALLLGERLVRRRAQAAH